MKLTVVLLLASFAAASLPLSAQIRAFAASHKPHKVKRHRGHKRHA